MTDTAIPQSNSYDTRVLREKAVAAKTAVADLAVEAKNYAADRLVSIKHNAGDKAKDVNDTVLDFVQRHPYKSIALAAGIGLALGMILKRR